MEGRSSIGIGVALGVSIGVALGVALDNLALWLSLGIAIGAGMGVAFDQQRAKKNKSEKGDNGSAPVAGGDSGGLHKDFDAGGADGGGDGGGGGD